MNAPHIALAAALSAAAVGTQEYNYHALSNGRDITIAGVGSGTGQTASDGIGVYIPGEDLRGATRSADGHFAYKQRGFAASGCVLSAPPSGSPTLHFPLVAWFELFGDGAANTAHDPIVFPNPIDPSCSGFPLGGSAGFVSFGTPAGSSASFVAVALPSAVGTSALVPNEGLVPSAAGGRVALLGAANVAPTPIMSTGFCWTSLFQWYPSATAALHDSTNGWWYWVQDNPLGNQYWAMSGDELNLWKSHTIASRNGQTDVIAFAADVEFESMMSSVQPNTNLATWPTTFFGASAYGTNTANVTNQDGAPAANPYGGYDLGGHGTLSITGEVGVPSVNTGLPAQDAAGVGGLAPSGVALGAPTIGFHTYDGTSDSSLGSKRIVWLTLDLDHLAGVSPDASSDLLVAGGAVRVPSPIPSIPGPFPQPLTLAALPLFGHEADDCPSCSSLDPLGLVNFFLIGAPQGSSAHVRIPPLLLACMPGPALPITYGSSALAGDVGVGAPAGKLVWDQAVGATSGSKTFFLFR